MKVLSFFEKHKNTDHLGSIIKQPLKLHVSISKFQLFNPEMQIDNFTKHKHTDSINLHEALF